MLLHQTSEQVAKLKSELEDRKVADPQRGGKKYATTHKCFFENSPTTVDIIESSPISDFAQYLISDAPDNNSSLKAANVMMIKGIIFARFADVVHNVNHHQD